MRNLIKNISIVFCSFLVALVIIEIILRLIGWGQIVEFLPNEEWGYLMKPSQSVSAYGHSVNINKTGLRGPEIDQRKREGILRILFVGDSITYGGAKIKEDNLFCRIVEYLLNNDGSIRAESINVSAPGWSPQNWIRYLKLNGLLNADIVVMVLPETDLNRNFINHAFLYNHKTDQPFLRIHAVFWKMYLILKSKVFPVSQYRWTSSDAVKLNVDAILQLMDLCNKNNIDFLPVLIPSNPPQETARSWYHFNKILLNPLDIRGELNDAIFFEDETHLSVKGHKYVGEKIHDRICKFIRQNESSVP